MAMVMVMVTAITIMSISRISRGRVGRFVGGRSNYAPHLICGQLITCNTLARANRGRSPLLQVMVRWFL